MTTADNRDPRRFYDPLTRLEDLANEILVRCPVCDGQACVIPDQRTANDPVPFSLRRRVSCLRCGHTATWTPPRHGNGWITPGLSGPDDPYFGLPLWLRADCFGGHVLWAYNAEHLDLLESYLTAQLRERGAYRTCPCSMSLVERLPAWLKAAKHREEALRIIRRLRTSLSSP